MYLHRRRARPLALLCQEAANDYGALDEFLRRDDDIGELARAFNHLRVRLDSNAVNLGHLVHELRDAQENLGGILAVTRTVAWSLNSQGGLVYISASAQALFGQSAEAFYRHPELWHSLICKEDRPAFEAGLRAVREHGFAEWRYRITLPDGEPCPLRAVARSLQDAHGVIRINGLTSDLSETERMQAEIEHNLGLLGAIRRAQAHFIAEAPSDQVFSQLLDDVLSLTGAEHGFIGEACRTASGRPYLRLIVASDGTWGGAEFYTAETLFGAALDGRVVTYPPEPGAPADASLPGFSAGSAPAAAPGGHAGTAGIGMPTALRDFLGLPFEHGREILGVFGLLNRSGGHDARTVETLRPILTTCANLVAARQAAAREAAAEHRLAESEARFRHAFDSAPIGMALIAADGRLLRVNRAFSLMIGRAEASLCASALADLVHPGDRPDLHDRLRRLLKGETAREQAEVRYRGASDQVVWGQSSVSLVEGAGDQLYFIAQVQDVSAAKRSAEELRRFKHVLDSTLDILFMFEPDGLRLIYFNRGASTATGLSAAELGRAGFPELFPALAGRFPERLAPLLRGERETLQFEAVTRRGDGAEVPLEVVVQYVHDGVTRGVFVALARDITERKRVERLKDEFVSTVSHELRTPLTSIRGALGLMAGGVAGELSEQAHSLTTMALKNSERLCLLINDILDIEKIESGNVRFELRSQPLRPLIEQALGAQEGYAAQYGVRLELGDCDPTAAAAVDADRFLQVMANLLSNAVKFSPRGEAVRTTLDAHGGCWRVAVADSGPGIAPEFRTRIFQKFSQADASDTRTRGGSGLGLAISRAVVERMGGALNFDSEPGRGATFFAELPKADGAAAGREPSRDAEVAGGA